MTEHQYSVMENQYSTEHQSSEDFLQSGTCSVLVQNLVTENTIILSQNLKVLFILWQNNFSWVEMRWCISWPTCQMLLTRSLHETCGLVDNTFGLVEISRGDRISWPTRVVSRPKPDLLMYCKLTRLEKKLLSRAHTDPKVHWLIEAVCCPVPMTNLGKWLHAHWLSWSLQTLVCALHLCFLRFRYCVTISALLLDFFRSCDTLRSVLCFLCLV